MQPVTDFHAHAFPDFLYQKAMAELTANAAEYRPFHDGSLAGLRAEMNRAGVGRAVVANIATRPGNAARILDWSLQIRSDDIHPLGSVYPGDPAAPDEIAAFAAAGFKGIKLHPMYQNFTVDDPAVYPVYEHCARHGLFILFHAGFDVAFPGNVQAAPARFAALRRDFPDLVMIISHAGGWQAWKEAVDVLAGGDYYIECSFATEMPPALLAELIRRHDPRKLLFGSDTPWMDMRREREYLEQAIGDAAQADYALRLNAARLLGDG